MNKIHPDFKQKQENVNEICPGCSGICNYGFQQLPTPEFCDKCGYDLRLPINPIRNFFHNLFWGFGGEDFRKQYPLAHCKAGYEEIKELEKMTK